MDDDMTLAEILKATAQDDQTRKILLIIKECSTIDEAVKKIEALLTK